MVANFSTVAGPGPAEAATPCTAAALTKAAPPTAASNRLILRISHPLPGTLTARPAGPCAYRSHVLLARQVQPGHKGPQAQVELPRVRPLRRHPTLPGCGSPGKCRVTALVISDHVCENSPMARPPGGDR